MTNYRIGDVVRTRAPWKPRCSLGDPDRPYGQVLDVHTYGAQPILSVYFPNHGVTTCFLTTELVKARPQAVALFQGRYGAISA